MGVGQYRDTTHSDQLSHSISASAKLLNAAHADYTVMKGCDSMHDLFESAAGWLRVAGETLGSIDGAQNSREYALRQGQLRASVAKATVALDMLARFTVNDGAALETWYIGSRVQMAHEAMTSAEQIYNDNLPKYAASIAVDVPAEPVAPPAKAQSPQPEAETYQGVPIEQVPSRRQEPRPSTHVSTRGRERVVPRVSLDDTMIEPAPRSNSRNYPYQRFVLASALADRTSISTACLAQYAEGIGAVYHGGPTRRNEGIIDAGGRTKDPVIDFPKLLDAFDLEATIETSDGDMLPPSDFRISRTRLINFYFEVTKVERQLDHRRTTTRRRRVA